MGQGMHTAPVTMATVGRAISTVRKCYEIKEIRRVYYVKNEKDGFK